MSKTCFLVLVAAVSATILSIIWANNNAATHIQEIRTETDMLLNLKGHPFVESNAQEHIETVRTKLADKRSDSVKPQLKQTFEAFVSAWHAAGQLTPAIVYAHRPLLNSVYTSYDHLRYNQLLAFFIDWLIWMTALTLSLFSNILRDIVGDTSRLQGKIYSDKSLPKATAVPDVTPPYSLARFQLIAWISIIASVYVYAVLWDCKDPGGINQTALILMGISAGTFVTAAVIDTTEIQQGIPRTQDQPGSGNFFKDILSDNNGVSVHRFQNFIWTLVAIVIYFYRYANPPDGLHNFLPELDNTLLALTGISSATYLTMKTRENPPEKLIAQIKITLDANASKLLNAAEITAVTANGFPQAVIVLTDINGNATTALPDLVKPNFDFLFINVIPDTYTITVTWTGQPIPGTSRTLTATWTGQLLATTTAMTIHFV